MKFLLPSKMSLNTVLKAVYDALNCPISYSVIVIVLCYSVNNWPLPANEVSAAVKNVPQHRFKVVIMRLADFLLLLLLLLLSLLLLLIIDHRLANEVSAAVEKCPSTLF